MRTPHIVHRFTHYSKLVKFNVLLLCIVLLGATLSVSFATGPAGSGQCGARVALVLDRSSSIGVDKFSGSRAQSNANISAIKVGANDFVQAIIGPDSYTDVYAFGSVAQRVNTGGWFNVNNQENANWQKLFIGGLKFKQGADSGDEDAYQDGMIAGHEGLTNWAGALNLVGATRQDPFPTHLVIFTDGNPTTNQSEVEEALRNGGRFPRPTDGVDADDVSAAMNSAAFLRAIGIKIIPVAVGAEGIVNMANLQGLAGPGNPVYRANNYGELSAMFQAAARNVCEQPAPNSTLGIIATDADTGALIPARFDYTDSPFSGPQFQTGGPGTEGWSYKTAQPKQNWGFKTSFDQSSAPDYEVVDVYCRSGVWTASSPLTGVKKSGGIDSDPAGYAPGTTVRCEYKLKKKFVPRDGIEIVKDVTPTVAKRGEAVTYSFVVKNTGNTKLTNIVVNDPMLGGKVGEIASLEVGATSAPITKSYTIPVDATGTVHNVASATGTPVNPDGTPRPKVSDDDPADVTVELRQGQSIEKTVSPSVAQVGTEVTYTISVKNTGETTLSNVVVSDETLEQEVTIAGPIEPGKTGTAQIKYTIKDGDFKNGIFTNIACIKGTRSCDDAKVSEPKVELTKSGPSKARPGEKVTYTFKVKNVGIVDLTNIEIRDETLSKYATSPVSIKIPGTLKPGESSDLVTYEFTIPKNFEGTVFQNVAVVHSNPIDPDTDKPAAGTDVTDDDDHDIQIIKWTTTKVADKKEVVPGTEVTYTITVTNTGGITLENIEVSDPTINFPADGKPVIIDSLAPGASKDIVAKYVIPTSFTGKTFKNVALVCVPDEDDNGKPVISKSSTSSTTTSSTTTTTVVSSSSSTTTTTLPVSQIEENGDCQKPTAEVDVARIQIVKTADKETAFPGNKVIYTFIVTNTGGVTYDPTPVIDNILGEIGDPKVLEPGQSETFTKEYIVPLATPDNTSIKNVATVCANINEDDVVLTEPDCFTQCPDDIEGVICDQDDHTLLVVIPSIAIEKTADKTTAAVGETVTYTFTITNKSKVELKNISVVDNVLGDLGKIDKLGPGESVKKSVAYVIPSTAATTGAVRNIATACFADPVYTPNCASDDHTVTVTAVLGTQVTAPAQALPFTGSSSIWLVSVAGLLIAAGAAIFFITRRRRNDAV